MPKLPRVQGPQVQRQATQSPRTPYSTWLSTQTPEAFSGGGREAARSRASTQQLGNFAIGIAEKEFAKANEVAVVEKINMLDEARTKLMEEFGGLKGKDAAAKRPEYFSKLQQEMSKIGDSLSNNAQREMFDRAAEGSASKFRSAAISHAIREQESFANGQLEARTGRAVDDFQKSGDENNLDEAMAAISSRLEGSSTEVIDAAKRDILGRAYAGRVNSLIRQGRIGEAEALVDSSSARVPSRYESSMREGLKRASQDNKEKLESEKILAEADNDPSKALEILRSPSRRKSYDAETYKGMLSFLTTERNQEEVRKREEKRDLIASMWEALPPNGDPRNAFKGMEVDSKTLQAMRRQFENRSLRMASAAAARENRRYARDKRADKMFVAGLYAKAEENSDLSAEDLLSEVKTDTGVMAVRKFIKDRESSRVKGRANAINSMASRMFGSFNVGDRSVTLPVIGTKVDKSGKPGAGFGRGETFFKDSAVSSAHDEIERAMSSGDITPEQESAIIKKTMNDFTRARVAVLSIGGTEDFLDRLNESDDPDDYPKGIVGVADQMLDSARGELEHSDEIRASVAAALKSGNDRLAAAIAASNWID